MSRKVNIEIEQGCSFQQEIELTNTDGTDFDVTDWLGGGTLRKHYLSNTAYAFTVTLSTGVCTMTMSANTTALLEEGLYIYDVTIEHPSELVHRVVSGMAYVSGAVTRN